MTPSHRRLLGVLADIPRRVVACSGGVDSLVLATVAHAADRSATTVAHTVTPAVPTEGTARVKRYAVEQGWDLRLVRSREFDDEDYLSNPVDRCYHCKNHLYSALEELGVVSADAGAVVLSGANTDDLGEYRPGLRAADEHGVRHPFVEASISKADIRAIAVELGLDAAALPASPCLASRVYTGTRVTAAKLQAIEIGEAVVKQMAEISVVRCRVRGNDVFVEVQAHDRDRVTPVVLSAAGDAMRAVEPAVTAPVLDPRPYEAGRAFVLLPQ